jgi:magnesium chelatase family protein
VPLRTRRRARLSLPPGPGCVERYQARISGPLLDPIDLQIEVPAVSAADLVLPAASEGSAEVRTRVSAARRIQAERLATLKHPKARTNADCDGSLLEDIAAPDPTGRTLLREAADALGLSARGYHRTLRVARTLADLDGEELVARIHIAEALSYRGETLRRAQAEPRYWHLHPQGPTRSVFGCAEKAVGRLQSYGKKRILRD